MALIQRNAIDLTGRIAVVTGAAQGIGRAVAARLISSGAQVALWDRDADLVEQSARELGKAASFQVVDQVDYEAVTAAAQKDEQRFGRIDILVANAGIAGANAPVADYDVDEWKRIIDVNLNGPFHCCKAILPGMISRGYGRIVNVASIAGKEGNPNAAAYSASKAAVIALTKSIGKETAGTGLSVNCVTPAAARTSIFDQMSQTHIDYMLSKIPRGRFLEVEEVAAMIAWLVSEENSFTTGAVFDLSGGQATY
ncbi:SDR family NAD(P)-dependent oxidoreductase [Chelativorans sp. Marseille-P2723]|uniref:SDR family NAD(P)-dependent oxidoreductase n=1 Tax=Chelativorans sp. Marseille-P2723 TaxID=2709133 RepID=UPI00156D692A|nr:SDR family NAD(P)-dependent oxidoreductase [Chelativorans sp. Marseille-P2723]